MEPWRAEASAIMSGVYRAAFFEASERLSFRRDGRAARWALDVRRALGDGEILAAVAAESASLLSQIGATQVVTVGCAGGMLLGGVLSSMRSLRGGVLREHRKTYGFRETVEGNLDRSRSIVLIDDILSSGRTALDAMRRLAIDGYKVGAVVPLFQYTWRSGGKRVSEAGCPVYPLASLTYRPPTRTSIVWDHGSTPGVVWEEHPAYANPSVRTV